MGMTIDEALEYLSDFSLYSPYQEVIDKVSEYIEQMQSDYGNRLKADMVTMLTEIQLDIEECVDGGEGSPLFEEGVAIARTQVLEMIQQKINEFKGDQDGNNS